MIQPPPPLRIGPIAVDFPVVLAALSGYSDWPTRVISRRLGAGYSICEVLLDQFVLEVTKGRKAKRYLRVSDEEHPVGAQLMGAQPEVFGPAALKLVEAGFDWIDINFGCPVKKVLGRCRGGYLLSQPKTALEILARVRETLPPQIPLTVKMRRGMDDSQKSLDDFYTIFDGAFQRGVAAITVHGRSVRQRYEGRSSWEFLRQVKQHAGSRTILGSGDLFSAHDCFAMMAQTGVDGTTVARGAIGNPWIFAQARALAAGRPLPPPPSLFEQRDVIVEHYTLAEQIYGPVRVGVVMRKFGIKYSLLHPQAEQVRDAFVHVRKPGQWLDVVRQWYAEDLPGRYPPSSLAESFDGEAEST
ncbi:MAG: tRNA-dihydrouridine synthase [Thermoguttaceae bacterium]